MTSVETGPHVVMARIGVVLSVAASVLGAIGVFSPNTLLAIGRELVSPVGLLAAAAMRVAFGAVLFLAAPASRAPRTIRLVGLVIVVAGVLTPFFGVDRARAILEWWASQGGVVTRIVPAVLLTLGCILINLLVPRRRAA